MAKKSVPRSNPSNVIDFVAAKAKREQAAAPRGEFRTSDPEFLNWLYEQKQNARLRGEPIPPLAALQAEFKVLRSTMLSVDESCPHFLNWLSDQRFAARRGLRPSLPAYVELLQEYAKRLRSPSVP